MNLKRAFIPEPNVEVTVKGRLGEALYWAGIVFSAISFFSWLFEEPGMIIAVPIFFFSGRTLMYILSGR